MTELNPPPKEAVVIDQDGHTILTPPSKSQQDSGEGYAKFNYQEKTFTFRKYASGRKSKKLSGITLALACALVPVLFLTGFFVLASLGAILLFFLVIRNFITAIFSGSKPTR